MPFTAGNSNNTGTTFIWHTYARALAIDAACSTGIQLPRNQQQQQLTRRRGDDKRIRRQKNEIQPEAMLTQWFFFLICVIYCIEQHIISDAHTCCCVFFLLLSLSISLCFHRKYTPVSLRIDLLWCVRTKWYCCWKRTKKISSVLLRTVILSLLVATVDDSHIYSSRLNVI